MIVGVYSVRDLPSGFNDPWCFKNDDLAIRAFSYQINNNDIMGFRASDFQLFQIGEFDTEKGDMKPVIPVLVVRGEDVLADK